TGFAGNSTSSLRGPGDSPVSANMGRSSDSGRSMSLPPPPITGRPGGVDNNSAVRTSDPPAPGGQTLPPIGGSPGAGMSPPPPSSPPPAPVPNTEGGSLPTPPSPWNQSKSN